MEKQPGKWKRLLWEILVLVALTAIGAAFHWWSNRTWEARVAEVRKEYEAKLMDSSRRLHDQTQSLAEQKAETMIRSFAAGLRPALLRDQADELDTALNEIIQLTNVVFAHVLDSDGQVLVTSDRKLAVTGRAGPRAAWALETTDFRVRDGAPGSLELALLIPDLPESGRILWMGWEKALRDDPPARTGDS